MHYTIYYAFNTEHGKKDAARGKGGNSAEGDVAITNSGLCRLRCLVVWSGGDGVGGRFLE